MGKWRQRAVRQVTQVGSDPVSGRVGTLRGSLIAKPGLTHQTVSYFLNIKDGNGRGDDKGTESNSLAFIIFTLKTHHINYVSSRKCSDD